MPLSLWNHFLPWAIILLQLVNKSFFSTKPPPTLGLNREFTVINIPPYQSIVVSLIFKKRNCDLLSLLFPFCLTPCVHWYAALCSRPLFQRFSFSLIALSTQDVPFFQSNPISTLFTLFFPPSSHCCIYWRFFFLVDINEWNLLYKVWIEITFESKQSWVFYVSIVQLHLPGEDYRRRLRQCELSFGGNNS